MTTPTDPPTASSYSELMLRALWASKSERQTAREAEYVETLLELPKRAQVLDVPCGSGRIALQIAAHGHHVTGVDLAASALALGRQAAAARGLADRLTWREGDMRDLPWEAAFDGAYCFWESFGYFDDAGNQAFAAAVARALRPGARFVIDTHTLETMLPTLARREWNEMSDGMLVMERREYDHLTSTVHRHWVLASEGQIVHESLAIRLYSYRELNALLLEAGFATCTGYTWMSEVPFMFGAPRLVMVATRG